MAFQPKVFLRDVAKMAIQNCILPAAYWLARMRHRGEKTLYVFADAHHTELPFSLEPMYQYIVSLGIDPVCHFHDYTHEGAVKSLLHSIRFMSVYAKAKYVFICDNFLPVSSAKKDPRTKVAQLCHFSGPFKKLGYATKDDIPAYYAGNMFRNYDLVTASSPMYVPILTDAMRQPPGTVQPLGVSRSDIYYDPAWVEACRQEFYREYPDAVEKKILLWAPTFRGNAMLPDALHNDPLFALQKTLGEDWLVLIKHHPHDDAVTTDAACRSNCEIPSHKLLPVVDLLITDYSTTVLDYLAFERPFLLYAPDLEEYEKTRGFFIDYHSITAHQTTDAAALAELVQTVYAKWLAGDRTDILRCKERFASACDGQATPRIFHYLQEK